MRPGTQFVMEIAEPDVPCCRQASQEGTGHHNHRRKSSNETTRLYQGHRNWRRGGRRNGRRAGDRAIDARNQMAHADKLAEIARHPLRRRRDDGQGRCRGHRQQVPDSAVRRRRDRAGTAGGRRRAERHRRDRAYRVLLLFRQGSDLRVRDLGRVRPQCTSQSGLVHPWRRQGSAQRVLQEIQLHLAACRQHRLSDGRLVPQGDQQPSTISRA